MTTPDPTLKERVLLGTAFTGAGIAHVVKHEWFEQLVPERFAHWRKPIGGVTAALQLVGGDRNVHSRLRVVARWVNLTMLVPTLPAAAAQINTPMYCAVLESRPL